VARWWILAFLVLNSASTAAQDDPVSRASNQPVEPFRIAGSIYYVGASDVTSFLVTTPQGHILIDGGFKETAPQIEANIQKLGFRVSDVRILLSSHAHFDHAGGLAELKGATGARFLASKGDQPLLARGGRGDPQFGDRFLFAPIHADGIVRENTRVGLGGFTLVAHITAGHTPGCTTWTTTIREGQRDLDVVFLCSATVPPEYRLVGNNGYPTIVRDYRDGFRLLKTLRPDIYLGSHGSFFGLEEKRKLLRAGAPQNPFIDPDGYQRFIALMETRFEAALGNQSAGRSQ
jgi:metallo-beta-lactamase class B